MARPVGAFLMLAVFALGRAAAQCPDGSPPPCRPQPARASAPPPNSVAVLYFDNLSPDTADAYLADGLTEEITSRLGDIRRLLVKQASRGAARRLRETAPDYRVAMGRALGVRYLVEGSLRRLGSRVRVLVRLVNAANGFRVWGQTYDRAAADLLDLQAEIAGEVATSIAGQLAPAERLALSERPTADPEAYEHFLRGNYYLAKRSASGFRRAIEEYETAASLDPGFTRAIARAGFAYELAYEYKVSVHSGSTLPALPRDSMLARGIALTSRALAQDSTVSDAWLARAYALGFLHPRSFEGVTAALERALALDPHNSEAEQQYAYFLRVLGQNSAARAAYLRSLAIEPGRPITLSALGLLSFLERRYDESRRWLDSALRVGPDFHFGYIRRARTRLMLRDPHGARADAETVLRLGAGDSSLAYALLAMSDVQTGDTTTARGRLDGVLGAFAGASWEVHLEDQLLPGVGLVIIGAHDQAIGLLEQVQPRGARLWSGLRSPEFEPIRADPRFARLVEESRPPGAPR